MNASTTRVLIYSHDTFGLGHLRRCLTIASGLTSTSEHTSVVIVTGSPRVGSFDLPERCDSVKLPAVTKGSDGTYRARALGVSLEEIIRMRADMLVTIGQTIRPSVVLVDHAPVGVEGELTPMLEALRRGWPRPKIIVGLRDVIDEAETVRSEWDRVGAWAALDDLYDRILVYGDDRYLTTASELGLADRYGDKVRSVGFLSRRPAGFLRPVREGPPMILVTVGGGGDGAHVVHAYASFLDSVGAGAPFRTIVVTGPFLPETERRVIEARLAGTGAPVEVLTFTDRLEEMMDDAAAVVSMCGYNTVVEILAAHVPAFVVPRRAPRAEQMLRAARLAEAVGFEACAPDDLGPDRIAAFVNGVLDGSFRGPAGPPPVALDGLANVVEEVLGPERIRGHGAHPGDPLDLEEHGPAQARDDM